MKDLNCDSINNILHEIEPLQAISKEGKPTSRKIFLVIISSPETNSYEAGVKHFTNDFFENQKTQNNLKTITIMKKFNGIGAVIKDIRESKNMKQTVLAELLNISSSYLSEIENGQKKCSLKLLQLISETFGIKISEMFFLVRGKKDIKNPQLQDIKKELIDILHEIESLQVSYKKNGPALAGKYFVNFPLERIGFSIGAVIKDIRESKNMKQTVLAELLNISSSYLSEIENGQKRCSLKLLQLISETFGIKISEMFFLVRGKKDIKNHQLRDIKKELIDILHEIESLQVDYKKNDPSLASKYLVNLPLERNISANELIAHSIKESSLGKKVNSRSFIEKAECHN
ncbi:MAG: helix-turn-helix domain-containing protein [Saprospiraceae bacterium]|nr:helix-turn-helix domain-containing protein [Saprospiraceae bacterium]